MIYNIKPSQIYLLTRTMIQIINFNNCTHNPILEGPVCNNTIYNFFNSRLGSFEACDILYLRRFGFGTFWGFERFEAWDVLELGCFGIGAFWG
jgi:hypothetical protein